MRESRSAGHRTCGLCGQLTQLEQQVLKSLQEHQLLSTDVDHAFDSARTRGELWADRIAAFGGSWTF